MYKSLISTQKIITSLTESFIDGKVELLEIFSDQHSLPNNKMVTFKDGVIKWLVNDSIIFNSDQ